MKALEAIPGYKNWMQHWVNYDESTGLYTTYEPDNDVICVTRFPKLAVASFNYATFNNAPIRKVNHKGTVEYFNEDHIYHRLDGPAVQAANGYQAWYKDGKYHREGGPAVTYNDGTHAWWIEGKKLTQAEFVAYRTA